MPKDFFDGLPKKTLDEMSVEELEDIKEKISVLVQVGKTKGRMLSLSKARQESEFVNDIVTKAYEQVRKEQKQVDDSGVRKSDRISVKENSLKVMRGFFAAHRKVEFMMKFLNGLELTDMIHDSRVKHFMLQEEIYPKLGESLKKLGDLNVFAKTEGLYGLTREQMVGVALNSENQGNLERLLATTKQGGNNLTIEQIQDIKENLTKPEKAFVEEIFQLVETLFPEMSKVTFNMTGLRPAKVDGRYFPIIADPQLSKRAEFRAAERDLFQEIFQQTYVEHSPTYKRVGGKDAVNLNILDSITRHIDGVMHYTAFAESVKDTQKVINNPLFKNMIEDIYNEETLAQFPDWLKM